MVGGYQMVLTFCRYATSLFNESTDISNYSGTLLSSAILFYLLLLRFNQRLFSRIQAVLRQADHLGNEDFLLWVSLPQKVARSEVHLLFVSCRKEIVFSRGYRHCSEKYAITHGVHTFAATELLLAPSSSYSSTFWRTVLTRQLRSILKWMYCSSYRLLYGVITLSSLTCGRQVARSSIAALRVY